MQTSSVGGTTPVVEELGGEIEEAVSVARSRRRCCHGGAASGAGVETDLEVCVGRRCS